MLENLHFAFSSASIFGNNIGDDTELFDMQASSGGKPWYISGFHWPDSTSLEEAYKSKVVFTFKTISAHKDIVVTYSKSNLKEDNNFISKNYSLIGALVIKFSVTRMWSWKPVV